MRITSLRRGRETLLSRDGESNSIIFYAVFLARPPRSGPTEIPEVELSLIIDRHDLFVHLWKGRNNPNGIITDPLVGFGQEMNFEDSQAMKYHWEFSVEPGVVIDYIGQVLAWTRLCMLEDAGDDFSGADYWADHVLLFDALSEDWGAEETIGFIGQDLFDCLATKTDEDPESERYQKAYNLTWRLLTQSSMQKITHGKNLTKGLALGVLWDMEENAGSDAEPGTFAELLRYGSVRFEQTREEIKYVKAKKPEKTLRKGLLEP